MLSVVPTHLMLGIDRDGGENKLSPERPEEHRRAHEGDVAVIS
jgi:hypothetical protein